MQIRHVHIERFRGIKTLDWRVDGQVICLVGPGDSTKSTILCAIDNEIHHRGQGYVYLRALGIEPPAFYDRT